MAVANRMLARVAVSGRSCRTLALNCSATPVPAGYTVTRAKVRYSCSSALAAKSEAPWHPLSSPRSTRRRRSVYVKSSDRESGRLCYAHNISLPADPVAPRFCLRDLVDLVDSLKDDLERLQNKQQAKVRQLGNDSPQVSNHST